MLPLAKIWVPAVMLVLADVMPRACGCGSPRIQTASGTATITAIEEAPANEENCDFDPVRVSFDFVEDGHKVPADSRERGQRLVVVSGRNPPRAFITRRKIQVGQRYPCQKEIYHGDVRYSFPDMEDSRYLEECYKELRTQQ